MANTINQSFSKFLIDTIRLGSTESDSAKSSKNWLIGQIVKFSSDYTFPVLHPDVSIDFGSFSRKTKIPLLDDIDLMIILDAQSNYRTEYTDKIEITVHPNSTIQKALCSDNSMILNSRKVINKLKEKLSDVPQYSKAEIKRNQEAVTLNLNSYPWVFDIVPCFITAPINGHTFFLIPDGNGHWKKSDPRIDKQRIVSINQSRQVSIYDLVRLVKFWNKRSTMISISSYMLEVMVVNYYEANNDTGLIRTEFQRVLNYIVNQIFSPVYDPKGFQGDLNTLSFAERQNIYSRASLDYQKALDANLFEDSSNHQSSIAKWIEIFGNSFPKYE